MRKLIGLLLLSWSVFGFSQKVNFLAKADTLNGYAYSNSALYIPLQFNGDTTRYYFQFDTGSNISCLYEGAGKFLGELNKYQKLTTNMGEFSFIYISSNHCYEIEGNQVIGTIGADFLEDKITSINFNSQELEILTNFIPKNYNTLELSYSFKRPVIKLTIQGNSFDLLFDTGSGIFDLFLTKKWFNKLTNPSSEMRQHEVQAWGKSYSIYGGITLYGSNLCSKENRVWYASGNHYKKLFKNAGIDGILGLQSLLNSHVVIDYTQHIFAWKCD